MDSFTEECGHLMRKKEGNITCTDQTMEPISYLLSSSQNPVLVFPGIITFISYIKYLECVGIITSRYYHFYFFYIVMANLSRMPGYLNFRFGVFALTLIIIKMTCLKLADRCKLEYIFFHPSQYLTSLSFMKYNFSIFIW
jgi:hypothetical protein